MNAETKREWTGMLLFFTIAVGLIVLDAYTVDKKSGGESVVSIQRNLVGNQ